MNLGNPNALWLIPAYVISAVCLGVWGWRAKKGPALWFRADLGQLRAKQIEKYLVAITLGALLAVAWAEPRLPFTVAPAPIKTGEIALLVDVSTSMAARRTLDAPTMLDRVKPMLGDLVDHNQELGGVRIALYGFTNMARSLVPFVGKADYPYLRASIDHVLDVGAAPGSGSGFGRPLLDVVPKFSKGARVKLIILFSDGEPFVGVSRGLQGIERGLMEQAIARVKAEGIEVVTVGVGEPEGAKIPISNAAGLFTGAYAQLHDADLVFNLKAEGLQEIAARTGGRYFGENDRRGLIEFVDEHLVAGPAETAQEPTTEYRSVASWLVLAGLPFWLVLARRFLLN